MRNALLFLGRFLVMAGLLYGAWENFSPIYLSAVVPTVNALFSALQLPVQLELRGSLLLLAYRLGEGGLRLQAHDYDVIYLNLITATALLAASPGKPIIWKFKWTGAVLVLLWITHVASFYISGQIAIWQYLQGLPAGSERELLAARVQAHFSLERQRLLTLLLAQWNIWGRYALAVGVWFFALRREIADPLAGTDRRPSGWPLFRVYRVHVAKVAAASAGSGSEKRGVKKLKQAS